MYYTLIQIDSDRQKYSKFTNFVIYFRCTVVYGTPTMYVDLVNLQKTRQEKLHLEVAVSGGAICSPHLFENMQKVLGVQQVKVHNN